jgi:hypothetical protein
LTVSVVCVSAAAERAVVTIRTVAATTGPVVNDLQVNAAASALRLTSGERMVGGPFVAVRSGLRCIESVGASLISSCPRNLGHPDGVGTECLR